MIANNTILALAVGAGLVGFSVFLYKLIRQRIIDTEGWAALFAVTGAIATAVGLATTLMWPYGTAEFAYANIEFGEPGLAFGVLLLAAAIYLWRNRLTAGVEKTLHVRLLSALKPISIFVFFLGLAMAFLAFAWVRFQMGAAPEIEPISGNFGKWPWLEATFLGGLWGLVALGALLFPLALSKLRSKFMMVVISLWMIAGIGFAVFGAMNMYTHIGMYYNASHHTEHKW